MQVCKWASLQGGKFARGQVCKWASLQVGKGASLQVGKGLVVGRVVLWSGCMLVLGWGRVVRHTHQVNDNSRGEGGETNPNLTKSKDSVVIN